MCACPILLTGLGLVLVSQFIFTVGYEFPTISSSQPDYLATLLCPPEIPPPPFSMLLFVVSIISC